MSKSRGEKIDLRVLSFDELKQVARDVEGEMIRRQEEDKERIFQDAQEMAERYGVSVETFLNPVEKGGRKEKAPVKYRNPTNPHQTWTGKGRQPTWVKELVEGGGTLEEMEIE